MENPDWGDFSRWGLALVVIIVALGFKFYTKGLPNTAAILLGMIAGYIVGFLTGADCTFFTFFVALASAIPAS